MSAATAPGDPPAVHRMAPLIRFTLLVLYLALVLPLPLMAAGAMRLFLWLAVPAGLILLLAVTSEQVVLDAAGIRVGHPRWCAWWLRRGWSLPWSRVGGLTAVPTSQGGAVFYIRAEPVPGGQEGGRGPAVAGTAAQEGCPGASAAGTAAQEGGSGGTDPRRGQAFLLPQRVERFEEFLSRFSRLSGVDCSTVRRLSPPWTYRLLAVLSVTMLLAELMVPLHGVIPGQAAGPLQVTRLPDGVTSSDGAAG